MMHEVTTSENDAQKRLDQVLKENLPEFSRARIQKAIREGHCNVDGLAIDRPDFRLRAGQVARLQIPDETPAINPETGEIKIIWQDKNLAICDKPAGLTVHPCPSCPQNTLAQRLLAHFPSLALQGGDRPGIVHRLDKDTSGLIAVALDENTRLRLMEEFADRKIEKEYLALVAGLPPETGECREPLGRDMTTRTKMALCAESHGGKAARTSWRRLWHSQNNDFSLLAVRIHTGRTHQIRVHLASLGFPILGDKLYAPKKAREMAPRQMLHAWRLAFKHPLTGEPLSFKSPPPEDFYAVALKHDAVMPRVVVTGNQGSGKSTFCRMLANYGLPVISADEIVAALYAKPGHASSWLQMRGFGGAINSDGSINKMELLEILRELPATKKEFEHLIHALTRDEIDKFWQIQENNGAWAAIAEIPLYFECGWNKDSREKILAVGIHSPRENRWKRLVASRGWDLEKTKAIEGWQMPEEKKMSLCDLVCDNSGDADALEAQAAELAEKLRGQAAADAEKLRHELQKLVL